MLSLKQVSSSKMKGSFHCTFGKNVSLEKGETGSSEYAFWIYFLDCLRFWHYTVHSFTKLTTCLSELALDMKSQ